MFFFLEKTNRRGKAKKAPCWEPNTHDRKETNKAGAYSVLLSSNRNGICFRGARTQRAYTRREARLRLRAREIAGA